MPDQSGQADVATSALTSKKTRFVPLLSQLKVAHMASIRKRDDKWQARVRRFGHPDAVKTFLTKTAAERWARVIEGSIEQGQFVNLNAAEHTLLGDVILRYIQTVTPQKRGKLIPPK